jgi:hypothetical protein
MDLTRADADARPGRLVESAPTDTEPLRAPHFVCVSCLILTINVWADKDSKRMHAENAGLCPCPSLVPEYDPSHVLSPGKTVPWRYCSGAFRPEVRARDVDLFLDVCCVYYSSVCTHGVCLGSCPSFAAERFSKVPADPSAGPLATYRDALSY